MDLENALIPNVSTAKTQLSAAMALAILTPRFGQIADLEPLSGGEVSQAFRFLGNGDQLILRANRKRDYSFDVWAHTNFSGTDVPVPEVLHWGQEGDLHWAVSRRAAGTMVWDLSSKAQIALVPQMVAILLTIHAFDISASRGYGWMRDGDHQAVSWKDHLLETLRWPAVDWPAVFRKAEAPQRAAIERCWALGAELISLLPVTPRVLRHGDFNQANLIADSGHITAVVDWEGAGYGDPLRDVAIVDLWTPSLNFPSAYLAESPQEQAELRVRCYQLIMAGNALGFFVHTNQPLKAANLLPKVLELIHSS